MMQAFSDPNLNALFIIIVIGGSIACGIIGVIRRRGDGSSPIEPVSRIAGIGALLGVAAAAVGILGTTGYSLLPIPTIPVAVFQNIIYQNLNTLFLGLLVASLLLQGLGSSGLRQQLESNFPYVIYGAFAVGALLIYSIRFGAVQAGPYVSRQAEFMSGFAIQIALFAIFWQLLSVMYTDTSKSWFGFLAGVMNGFFIPFVALGQIMGGGIIYIGYIFLLVGQFSTFLYWWSPLGSIREFARTPNKAKFAFGLSGFLTFVIGASAVLIGPLTSIGEVSVWRPWSTLDPIQDNMFVTSPALVFALCTSMVFWIMLAPRLGAKELQLAHVGEDIVRGGVKWFMVSLAALGIITSALAGTMLAGAADVGLWLSITPAAVMFLMGALYAASTDIITGIPLAITSIFIMVHPFAVADFVIIPWIIVIITQGLMMIETLVRGFTSYSQGSLSVILSILTSIIFVMFLLGGFGSGPAAIWPTNQWFNIRLLPGIPEAIQSPTIVALPALALLMRNVSLAGYSHGRGYTGGQMLMSVSVIFALMIPMIAFNVDINHVASTAAAVLLALYAISFVLVLSLNLNLSSEVENKGHAFEGQFIRVTSMIGIALGAVVSIIVISSFTGFPSPLEVAFVIRILVTLIVGLEILCIISWLVAGVRLGMLREGFSFTRVEHKL